MGVNQHNYNERGEILSYELSDVFEPEYSSPFPQGNSKVPPGDFDRVYKSFVGKYPFNPKYLNTTNPYTKKKIQTKADYYQYLREHCYLHICDSYVDSERNRVDTYVREADTKLYRAQSRIESLEKELSVAEHNHTVLTDRNASLDTKLKYASRRLTRTRRIVFLFVVLLAGSIFFGVRSRDNAYTSGQRSGRESGYAEGVAKMDAAIEEESAKSYEHGQKAGYQSGYAAGKSDGYVSGKSDGYADGYGDGASDGYQSGYSDGVKVNSGYSSQPSTSSGTHSGGDSTGSHRDTPIADAYIGNKNSHIFHHSTCSYLPDAANQITFDSRDEAIAAGYEPCGHCHP